MGRYGRRRAPLIIQFSGAELLERWGLHCLMWQCPVAGHNLTKFANGAAYCGESDCKESSEPQQLVT